MSNWPASKARRVLAALERIGWRVKRQRGSHRLLTRPDWPDYEFAFHDQDEIGPRMLARVAKRSIRRCVLISSASRQISDGEAVVGKRTEVKVVRTSWRRRSAKPEFDAAL